MGGVIKQLSRQRRTYIHNTTHYVRSFVVAPGGRHLFTNSPPQQNIEIQLLVNGLMKYEI